MRKILPDIALAAVSIMVCLASAEGLLRVFWPQIQNMNVKHNLRDIDPEVGGVPRIMLNSRMEVLNTFNVGVTTNSIRLRGGAEYALERAPDTRRVLFLGDSFTFGWGLEDHQTLPARFEKELASASVPAEVMNAGVYAFDTGHYLRWYRRFAHYRPDLVIVGFCLENDFDLALEEKAAREAAEAADKAADEARDRHASPFVSSGMYQWFKQSILLRSHLLAFVRDRLYVLFPDIRKYLFYIGVADKREIFLETYPEGLDLRLRGVERNLNELKTEIAARGGQMIVAAVPLREQIYSADAINRFKGFDARRPNRALKDICERLGLPLLDLTDAFAERASLGQRLYYETDPHLNPLGAAAAAEALAAFVLAEDLLNGGGA